MREIDEAFKASERDARTRMLIMSCVVHAVEEHGPVDPGRAEREAHDIGDIIFAVPTRRELSYA